MERALAEEEMKVVEEMVVEEMVVKEEGMVVEVVVKVGKGSNVSTVSSGCKLGAITRR